VISSHALGNFIGEVKLSLLGASALYNGVEVVKLNVTGAHG
jgi:hypothetical protein